MLRARSRLAKYAGHQKDVRPIARTTKPRVRRTGAAAIGRGACGPCGVYRRCAERPPSPVARRCCRSNCLRNLTWHHRAGQGPPRSPYLARGGTWPAALSGRPTSLAFSPEWSVSGIAKGSGMLRGFRGARTNPDADHLLARPARRSRRAESEKILRSCVHCGFCTATCPTYVLLGDELDSPRGRIYLIKDMLENAKPASPRVVTHIDRCLSCLSCMTTCPSGVHYMHLVDHARRYIEETYTRPWPRPSAAPHAGRGAAAAAAVPPRADWLQARTAFSAACFPGVLPACSRSPRRACRHPPQ